jgi:hypothetical protein
VTVTRRGTRGGDLTEPVRLALVGCGRIAQTAHLPAVEKAEGVKLVAVSDPLEHEAHRYEHSPKWTTVILRGSGSWLWLRHY